MGDYTKLGGDYDSTEGDFSFDDYDVNDRDVDDAVPNNAPTLLAALMTLFRRLLPHREHRRAPDRRRHRNIGCGDRI